MITKIEMFRGEARLLTWTIKDADTGLIVDLTGHQFALACKQDIEGDLVFFSHNNADFIDSGAANGRIQLLLTTTDLDLVPGDYFIQLSVSDPVLNDLFKDNIVLLRIKPAVV